MKLQLTKVIPSRWFGKIRQQRPVLDFLERTFNRTEKFLRERKGPIIMYIRSG
jgi:hypothetical protein